ncbi:hypothetical protein AB0E69_06630 [Kribbella sp. NPDC026611]|uniref:hypothetical protein n=1 Tax=Kribbella sp. NPDC026611 TaxID=3154911 RepID=UPI0033ECD248
MAADVGFVRINGYFYTRRQIQDFQDRQQEQYARPDQGGVRHVRIRLAVERVALAVQEHSGASQVAFWRAELGTDADTKLVRWEGGRQDGRLYLGQRSFEVIGELAGRTGRPWGEPDLGSSIDEQRDTLYELVAVAAHSAESPAPDAPAHRRPHLDEGVDGLPQSMRRGDEAWNRAATIEQHLFSHEVNALWAKTNFGPILDRLRAPQGVLAHLNDRTFRELAGSAPLDPGRRRQTEGHLAEGVISKGTAKRLLRPPKTLELTTREEAVRGFLDDLADRAGVERAAFLNTVMTAPPAQKAWQIAGALLASTPVPAEVYAETRERLSVAIDRVAPAVSTEESRHRATAEVDRAVQAIRSDHGIQSASEAPQVEARSAEGQSAGQAPRVDTPATAGNGVVRGGFGLPGGGPGGRRREMTPTDVTAGQGLPGARRELSAGSKDQLAAVWRGSARRTGPAADRPAPQSRAD